MPARDDRIVYPAAFNGRRTGSTRSNYVGRAELGPATIAQVLLRDVSEELDKWSSSAVYRPREIAERVTCGECMCSIDFHQKLTRYPADGCSSELFRSSQACLQCGKEFCVWGCQRGLRFGCGGAPDQGVEGRDGRPQL